MSSPCLGIPFCGFEMVGGFLWFWSGCKNWQLFSTFRPFTLSVGFGTLKLDSVRQVGCLILFLVWEVQTTKTESSPRRVPFFLLCWMGRLLEWVHFNLRTRTPSGKDIRQNTSTFQGSMFENPRPNGGGRFCAVRSGSGTPMAPSSAITRRSRATTQALGVKNAAPGG